jgi:hypothetical protein
VALSAASGEVEDIGSAIEQQLLTTLRDQPYLRNESVQFDLDALSPVLSSDQQESLARKLSIAWDGLRRLPYDDDDLAASLTQCVALELTAGTVRESSGWTDWELVAETLVGPVAEVEFASHRGGYSRSYVSKERLRAMLRSDLFDLTKPEFHSDLQRWVEFALSIVYSPPLLADFGTFTRFFVRDVVPTQVMWRSETSPEVLVFSPAELQTFGRP